MTVAEIMNRNVVSVSPTTPLLDAMRILTKNSFDGVPVVAEGNRLVGILTEYDLIHFIQPAVDNSGVSEKSREKMDAMTVVDVMNTDPLTVQSGVPVSDIILLFRDHHRVNPVPVVDEKKMLVGIISRYDIIKLFEAVPQ